ncbi:calcium-binding protein [Acuticoccus kandeliae]|uniref:calcium-binding protein n=1 Tax=Acuticoccus kandeliae TaxID=2073160 RepID=UPI000D3E0994|nr:hypothetical protein [Acuticoccus kandeliae]
MDLFLGIFAGFGNDTIELGEEDNVVIDLAGNDSISTGGGNDFVFGGFGNDTVDGGEGNDVLLGGAGSDQLIGGLGTDIMTGGNGSDHFGFASDHVRFGDIDTIADFNTSQDSVEVDTALQYGVVGTEEGTAVTYTNLYTIIFVGLTAEDVRGLPEGSLGTGGELFS